MNTSEQTKIEPTPDAPEESLATPAHVMEDDDDEDRWARLPFTD